MIPPDPADRIESKWSHRVSANWSSTRPCRRRTIATWICARPQHAAETAGVEVLAISGVSLLVAATSGLPGSR